MTQPRSSEPVDDAAVSLQPPSTGVDVIAYAVEDTIRIALSIRDERLGEFAVPPTPLHAASLAQTLRGLLHMTPDESQALLRDLSAQQ